MKSEKATHGMRESICKPFIWKEIDIQNIPKKTTTQQQQKKPWLINGQSIWTFSLKKIHRWQINIWKDAQHHYSLGTCKWKPQWDTNS